MTRARWVWVTAGALTLLGCVALAGWILGDSEPTLAGTVRLDGQLLSKGSIALAPIDGTPGPGGGGGINKDGTYEIRRGLQPGRYRVEIRSTKTLQRRVRNPTIPSEIVPEEVSIIPERYNTESREVLEVGPGSNVKHFELEPAPGRK